MMKRAGDDEHDACATESPSPLPLNTISRRVPSMLRQIQRIMAAMTQAQPMMVMTERRSRCQPR